MNIPCPQCGHSLLAHANLKHNSLVHGGKHSPAIMVRTNLRVRKGRDHSGISYCYLCRLKRCECRTMTSVGHYMREYDE